MTTHAGPTVQKKIRGTTFTITRAPGGRGKVLVQAGDGPPVEGRIETVYPPDEDHVLYRVRVRGMRPIPICEADRDALAAPVRARRRCDQCGEPLRKHGLPGTRVGDGWYCHDCA